LYRRILPSLLVLGGLVLLVLAFLLRPDTTAEPAGGPAPTLRPTPTPEPVSPTRTPTVPPEQAGPGPATASETVELVLGSPLCLDPDCRQRFGVSGQPEVAAAAYQAGLPFGPYLSWWVHPDPPQPGAVRFWQLVKLNHDGPAMSWDSIESAISSQPGSVWIVGNEPDVIWQDNLTAEAYARHYNELYTFIKSRDPQARLAVAGVTQPTPLRLAYLDRVLDVYRAEFGVEMPVDIWTVHGFILREEAGSWGVEIPPGMDETAGRLYEIADHDDLGIFARHLLDFRDWMAQRGYQDRPLALTEFGILHPGDYGFPPERVVAFMAGALDILINARADSGLPADDYRLVQWWFWYSLYDGEQYPTSNLFDPAAGELTVLGRAYAAFMGEP
jgi:hypothetical protein